MLTNLFKRIRKKGYLMVGYSFLKALGCLLALVLERLLTEYQHANRHEWIYKGYFCINITYIADYIGFTKADVIEAINNLSALNFISLIHLEGDFYGVYINEDEIYEFEKTIEAEKDFKQWDYKLYSLQQNGFIFMLSNDVEIQEDEP